MLLVVTYEHMSYSRSRRLSREFSSIFLSVPYRFASVSVSVRLAALSRSHFLIDFHQNWHRRNNPQKEERVRSGGQYRTTSSRILSLQTLILGQEVLKTHATIKQSYICLKCTRIAEIYSSFRKSGPRNTIRCPWHKPATGYTILFWGCVAHAL